MKGFGHMRFWTKEIRFWTQKITGSRGSRKYVIWQYEYLEGGVGQKGISREGVEILERGDTKSGQKRSWVEDVERRVLGSRGIQKEEYLDRNGSRQKRFWIERFLDNRYLDIMVSGQRDIWTKGYLDKGVSGEVLVQGTNPKYFRKEYL